MSKILIISPHLDDAILSAGQFIAANPNGCTVMTVFAGFPKGNPEARYDKKMGFANAKESVAARRLEDIDACEALRSNHVHLPYPDGQYGERVDIRDIASTILGFIKQWDYELVLFPVGLGHADHIRTADAMRLILPNIQKAYIYEEIPYRLYDPKEAVQKTRGHDYIDFPVGDVNFKKAALTCYKSQIGEDNDRLNMNHLLIPERFWSA